MSEENVVLVRKLYESGMDPDVVSEIVADDLVWDITPGAPWGGVYHEAYSQNPKDDPCDGVDCGLEC